MADNTVLGRGKIYFSPFASNIDETEVGFAYFGNTPSFGLSAETQEIEHYSAEEGLRVKDQSVTIQVDYSATIVCDNISPENIALFFFGTSDVQSQASTTNQQEDLTVKNGQYYQIGSTLTNPGGLRELQNVSVAGSGGTPTYVAGTDYNIDLSRGFLEIIEGGGIADDTAIEVTYDTQAVSRKRVLSGSQPIFGAVRFNAFNGVGENTDFYMPKVAIRPNGEFQLKGDEWQQLGFNVEVLQKTVGSVTMSNVYADGQPYTP